MFDIICVTNSSLCGEDILVRIEKLAAARPRGIILREKELSENDYETLAKEVLSICEKHGTPCILHSFADIAIRLDCKAIHLPLPVLRALPEAERAFFTTLGASCHSREDAAEAEKAGCTYITAGHVFDTGCKQGLPGRGLDFLRSVCESVSVPVYAIGGVCAENIAGVMGAGAKGACVMSGAMTCADPKKYLSSLLEKQYEVQ